MNPVTLPCIAAPDLVFLPATEPGDLTYGSIPERVSICPHARIHVIRFPKLVWYNGPVRKEAIDQIQALGVAPVILVGFSKSGLGAWNIARTIPSRVAGTIIFDAPVVREECPPWGTGPFYPDPASWQEDLPLHTIAHYRSVMPATHKLVLISGVSFHDEMRVFSNALSGAAVGHVFLPRPAMPHHWQSGWIEEGVKALLDPGLQRGA